MEHPIGNLMETTMQKIREMVDANTIIGKPIETGEGVTLIPISKVSFGFASGGADMQTKVENRDNGFGGGSGAGVKITPVSFIVVKGENIKILNVTPSDDAVDRLVGTLPDIVDKITGAFKKEEKVQEDI